MTCGLTQVGTANIESGEELGLHGRFHHIAAREVASQGTWENDEFVMNVKGVVEETTAFGQYLRLTREYKMYLGKNEIHIKDVVENVGFSSSPHMILYHFNFGFPFINENTIFTFPSNDITARDKGVSTEGYDQWNYPETGYQERVYYHENLNIYRNGENLTSVVISNPTFPSFINRSEHPLSLRLSWDTTNLPRFTQWKMNGAGMNVLGIEPGNCYVEGRKKERERGSLVMLEPGESRTYHLKLEIF